MDNPPNPCNSTWSHIFG